MTDTRVFPDLRFTTNELNYIKGLQTSGTNGLPKFDNGSTFGNLISGSDQYFIVNDSIQKQFLTGINSYSELFNIAGDIKFIYPDLGNEQYSMMAEILKDTTFEITKETPSGQILQHGQITYKAHTFFIFDPVNKHISINEPVDNSTSAVIVVDQGFKDFAAENNINTEIGTLAAVTLGTDRQTIKTFVTQSDVFSTDTNTLKASKVVYLS